MTDQEKELNKQYHQSWYQENKGWYLEKMKQRYHENREKLLPKLKMKRRLNNLIINNVSKLAN